MDQKAPYERLFHATSTLTDHFPRAGARVLDAFVGAAVGNPLLLATRLNAARRHATVGVPGRILVVADMNIGDAVMLQAALSGLRDFFPLAEIDYVIGRTARTLVDGNPEISTLWPLYTGPHPTAEDHASLSRIARNGAYDLILSFCPFFNCRALCPPNVPTVDYGALAAMLVHNERLGELAHVVHSSHAFVHALFGSTHTPARHEEFRGVTVTLSDDAVAKAQAFMARNAGIGSRPVVLFNPDASSIYTRLPLSAQAALVRRVLATGAALIMGAGHAAPGIEKRVLAELSAAERREVHLLPASVSLDAYAAVVDLADVFITADTGPLHVAAARKMSASGKHVFRNRTAVLALFGATSPRIYGYDSTRPAYMPANQDAPSFTYSSASPCRNLTCINKSAKSCREIRCFDGFDVEDALRGAVAWLSQSSVYRARA